MKRTIAALLIFGFTPASHAVVIDLSMARVVGAEQSVDLLLRRLQSVAHHVDIVGQQQHPDAAAQSAQGERVTGERSSGALAT